MSDDTRRPEMRVMSFNIRNNRVDDGVNSWPKRCPVIARMWARVDPDVVGIQEDWPDQRATLAELAPGFEFVGRGRDADGGGPATALGYRSDAFECLESGDFWLSEQPDEPGSRSFDSAISRKATWVRLREPDGRTWLVVNTHLDHRGEVARAVGAQLIQRFVADRAGSDSAVVTGDFNALPDSPPLRMLLADGALTDGLAEVGERGPTFHRFTGVGNRRIDYILTSADVTVTGGGVVPDHDGPVYASDHFPIYADVRAR
jgi:endonuclease/exonuclease/phosphatase family metal-dependent hydrolase